MLFVFAGMTATEQELAYLHADALLMQQRLQLAAGMREAAAKVTSKRDQLLASTLRRDKQAAIFGPRTQKEKRLDEAAVEAAGKLPSSNEVCLGTDAQVALQHLSLPDTFAMYDWTNCMHTHTRTQLSHPQMADWLATANHTRCATLQACERALLQQCSKNVYQRALLLMQIAAYHPSVERQAAALEVRSRTSVSLAEGTSRHRSS
jgi:hypothetical protein